MKSCFSQPTKEVLLKKLQAVAEKMGWQLGFSEENKPNKQWLIQMLSTFTSDDEIFNKGYVAPPVKKK